MFGTIRITEFENGTELEVKGEFSEIMSDLTIIISHVYKALVKNGVLGFMAKSFIHQSVDLALMNKSQMEELAAEAMDSLLKYIANSLDEEERKNLEEKLEEIKEEVEALKNE